jgi:hypothetical protein
MRVSPVFANLLRAGRPQFNARVAEARHRYPGFNTAAFADFLQNCVDPVIEAVNRLAPESAGGVAVAAYDIALDLVGRDLAGPHQSCATMNRLWRDHLPALAVLLTDKPALVIGALSNALVNLDGCQARTGEWLELVRSSADGLQTSDQLLQLGVLAAWRAGAAHFRPAALRAARVLPAESVARVLVLEVGNLEPDLAELDINPWHLGDKRRELGAFSGFGGLFREPPQVRVNQDNFIVMSGGRCHLLMADGFGAVLLPASREEFEQAESDSPRRGKIKNTPALDLPEDGLRLASNSHTVAVTSPFSFAVHLVPR